MSIIGSLFKVIKKIVKSVITAIVNILKKIWWVILLVILIYFAWPYLLAYAASAAAPAWLLGVMTYVSTTVAWLWASAGALFAAGWTTLASWAATWSLSTWATIAGGVSMLLAPEETNDFIKDVIDEVVDVGGDLIGGLLGGSLGTYALVGVGVWLGYKWLVKPRYPSQKRVIAK